MKGKTVILMIISCALIISASTVAYATQGDIAVIGGADGPTAIFVAEPDPTFLFVALAVAVISLVIIAIIILKRRKKK